MLKGHKLLVILVLAVLMTSAVFLFFFGDMLLLWHGTPKIDTLPNNIYDKTITVVADYDYDPYSFYDKNGKPSGYDIELINILANKMKVNVEIKLMSWNEAEKAILDGEADIIMGLDYKPESRPEYELSIPFHNDQFVAFGIKKLSKFSELYSSKVAALRGSISIPLFLEPYQLEKNITLYDTYTDVFLSVARGENDFAISRYSVGRRAISKIQNRFIQDTGPMLASNHMCLGAKKGNTELIAEIDTIFIELMKNGTIETLAYKWLGRYIEVLNAREFLLTYRHSIAVSLVIIVLCIAVAYTVISRKLVKAAQLQRDTIAKFLEYQQLLSEATKGLYESIYEIDITHDRAGDEYTRKYVEHSGLAADTSCDMVFRFLADKFIKNEFSEKYFAIFNRDYILKSYEEGEVDLKCDLMATFDGENCYWVRVTGRIFFWNFDNSIRLLMFRQNIDNEKKHEIQLFDKSRRDPLTNLYNKLTTEDLVNDAIKYYSGQFPDAHAFFILDIDNFKIVNDTHGHKFGDQVIIEFATVLKSMFRETDIIGRIGGDEFVVFVKNIPNSKWVEQYASHLSASLNKEVTFDSKTCIISASIGIAILPNDGLDFVSLYKNADSALYLTKNNGKNGFTLYSAGV